MCSAVSGAVSPGRVQGDGVRSGGVGMPVARLTIGTQRHGLAPFVVRHHNTRLADRIFRLRSIHTFIQGRRSRAGWKGGLFFAMIFALLFFCKGVRIFNDYYNFSTILSVFHIVCTFENSKRDFVLKMNILVICGHLVLFLVNFTLFLRLFILFLRICFIFLQQKCLFQLSVVC